MLWERSIWTTAASTSTLNAGVWLYNTDSVLQIKEDFLKTLEVCHEFDLAAYRARSPLRRAGTAILRLFAPLM